MISLKEPSWCVAMLRFRVHEKCGAANARYCIYIRGLAKDLFFLLSSPLFCIVPSCPFHLHALEVVQLHLTYPHPLSQLGTGRGDFDRRLSDRSWWLCTTVGARLRQEGVDLMALDD